MSELDNLFGGGTRVGLQFPKIGTKYSIRILDFTVEDQLDMQTQQPKTWPNGEVMKQVVIKGESTGKAFEGKYNRHTEVWEEIEDDDNVRYLFCAGGIFTAVKKALRDSGAKIAKGGVIEIAYTGVGKPSQPGYNPPKRYEAKYTAPSATEAADPFAV